uniref:Integrase core domain containing protein n=1 Tax=Solanum tuberosum TaxID=4113 RepID=M1DZH3_SOLTU
MEAWAKETGQQLRFRSTTPAVRVKLITAHNSQAMLSEPEDDHPLQSRRVEIRARSHTDLARVPTTSSPADTVLAPALPLAPVPPVVPPPRLLNRLKNDGL